MREVRAKESFELNVFQSARERAPVDEVPASPRVRVEPVTVSPLLGAETLILPSFELNVFQSVLERYPFTPLVACEILNTHEPEL